MEKRGRREGVGQAANHTAWSGQNQYKAGRNFVTFFHQLYVTIFLLLLVRFFFYSELLPKNVINENGRELKSYIRIQTIHVYL